MEEEIIDRKKRDIRGKKKVEESNAHEYLAEEN